MRSQACSSERQAAPAGPKTIAVALALLPSDDQRRRDLARTITKTATPHEAHPRDLLQPGPGMGQGLSRVRLDASHGIARFPRGPAGASSCRLGTCRQASGGKRVGTADQNIGQAHRTWAFAAAAAVCLRHPPRASLGG
jgi:hypothetical protein